MIRTQVALFMLSALLTLPMLAFAQARMMKAEEPDEVGYTSVGQAYFPVPEGAKTSDVPNGSFEAVEGKRVQGWHCSGFKRIEGDAPHGGAYVEAPAGARAMLGVTDLPVEGNRPHLLSMWLRSTTPSRAVISAADSTSRFGRHIPRELPSTDGKWKRVGIYFRMPDGATRANFSIRFGKDVEHGAVAIDDVRLRTAPESEFAKAYDGWRSRYPKRDLAPRPTDGQSLALTIRKLENGLDPDRPFLIWAIGSSYTNMLGMGETLKQSIRKRFPNAPLIVYKKHVGSSAPWHYIRGWVYHKVLPEQPDLVQIYTIGKPEELDQLIQDIRRHSTADIVVPSIHWRMRDAKNWGKSEDAADQNVEEIRQICKKHGVEFVESRKEWAEYMNEHGMKVEIDAEKGLLKDAVHQSDYGALVINENIGRHFAKPATFRCDPDERERRLAASGGTSIRRNEKVETSGEWQADGKCMKTSAKGARIKVTFQGNRIDLIGVKSPNGGTAKVLIDGKPADEADAFFMTYITPGPKNNRPARGMTEDQSPHRAILGKDVVPQKWTITMTSDTGDFKLEGSVTGPDGEGHCLKPFTSTSGQIALDPQFWRRAQDRKGNFNNKTGDIWTWEVYRCAVGDVTFTGAAGKRFREKLVQNLDNGEHVLDLIANGDGEITVEAFDVFEPPLR